MRNVFVKIFFVAPVYFLYPRFGSEKSYFPESVQNRRYVEIRDDV